MIASLLHISTGCGWWKIPEELGGVVYSDAAPVGSLINTNSRAEVWLPILPIITTSTSLVQTLAANKCLGSCNDLV
jgi:hypothetical protein